MTQGLVGLVVFITTAFSQNPALISPLAGNIAVAQQQEQALAAKSLSLSNRYPDNDFVNQVFRDNMLLALHYLGGKQKSREIDWQEIRGPFKVSFVLQPTEVFAFHNNSLPEFKEKVVVSPNSRFYADEGYKNSGWIIGDGVCHLASLINWVAADAGLKVTAKASHDFRPIPDIPKEFGTSIRYSETGYNSQNQNLYIENNLNFAVEFKFKVDEDKIELMVLRASGVDQ